MSDNKETFEGEIIKVNKQTGRKYVERINYCPVCNRPDGTYEHLTEATYSCGRYQTECKLCAEEGWSYEFGTGSSAKLSYKGHRVDLYNKRVQEPYKETVTRSCFLD